MYNDILNLKLDFNSGEIAQNKIDALYKLGIFKAKLTTIKLNLIKDKKDNTKIREIRNIKLIFESPDKKGIFILIGNIKCSFTEPYGACIYIKKIIYAENLTYLAIKGYEFKLEFSATPTKIEIFQDFLAEVTSSKEFIFNISQFDEFMELFEYYKLLASKLNSNESFEIKNYGSIYKFVSVNEKEIYNSQNELINNLFKEIYDEKNILIGYKISDNDFNFLSNSLKRKTKDLIDISIKRTNKQIDRYFNDYKNIYLSNIANINDKNDSALKVINVMNVIFENDSITLTIEYDGIDKYRYVNIYDMGQKIKLDSIENSLRLIKQGASGSAISLIEYLIGDKPMVNNSEFGNETISPEIIKMYTDKLNNSQKQAFLKAVDGSPITLIKGPPGTGKTHVINSIVQYLTKVKKEKIIISSQTHVAIDNVLDKLMENHDLIIPKRITNRKNKYSIENIDRTLFETWGQNFEKHNDLSSNKSLAKNILEDISYFNGEESFGFSSNNTNDDYYVIGATTTTAAISGKKGIEMFEDYKWLIIDEVSKCPITEVLRYLPYIENIIMVGDDYQLSPLLEFNKDDVKHFDEFDEEKFDKLEKLYKSSVFESVMAKAKQANRIETLTENYRSVKDILDLYNFFYNHELLNLRETVLEKQTHFSEDAGYLLKSDALFVDVLYGKELEDSRRSRMNREELEATTTILKDILKYSINSKERTISIIFPYSYQLKEFIKLNSVLINKTKKRFKLFEIDTIDAFQGRESDIVIVNTVVTDQSKRNFLNDFRRINVAMSRAKDKLIILGNRKTLSNIEMKTSENNKRKYFGDIITTILKKDGLITYDGEKGGFMND